MRSVVLACVIFGAIAGSALAGDRSNIGGSARADQPPKEPFALSETSRGDRAGPSTASLAMREALARAACRDRFGAEVSCAATADDRRYGGAMKRNGSRAR